jgi:pyocin large subunit-like protein
MTGFKRFWLIAALLGLASCDAGPSAVLKDGEGKAASSPVAVAPVAEPETPASAVAPEPSVEPETTHQNAGAPNFGKPLPIAVDRATVTAKRYGDWPLWSSNRKYSTEENARYHFERHGPEFGAKSYDDYMAMVHGFIHSPPDGTEVLKRNNGDTLFYDPKGNVFAVMTKTGAPRTMFRPDDGAAYWNRQKIIESKRRTMRDE